jgi:hypothetical protein
MAGEGQDSETARDRQEPEPSPEIFTFGTGLLLFVLGFALAFPLATAGWSFFADNADLVAALFLSVLAVLLALAATIVIIRRWLWRRIFATADVRLQAFAEPLADVARHAAASRAPEAVEAARVFARVALARWAWISTRRWLIASITGLIAAMAALVGAALLFRQNELLVEQIERLDRQNQLIGVQLELADAQRAAGLIGEFTAIAGGIEAAAADRAARGEPQSIDAGDLPASLQARIVAASIAARPYRIIDRNAEDTQTEAARLRPDLPRLAAYLAERGRVSGQLSLTERPLSPERGLILLLLYHSGLVRTEALHRKGGDFSGAAMSDMTLALADYRGANLARADFSRSYLVGVNFAGAVLDGAWFRGSVLRGLVLAEAAGPAAGAAVTNARFAGADFTGAVIAETTFGGVTGGFQRFDAALLYKASFGGTPLDGATFRGTVLLDVDFAGASLASADFDGAIVTDAHFIETLATGAVPGSFKPEMFRLEPIDEAAVRALDVVLRHLGVEIPEETLAGRPLFRVRRIADFT